MATQARTDSWRARQQRFFNRIAAHLAARGKGAAAFTSQPEPRTIGSFARGRQLIAGNFLFAGALVEDPSRVLWDLEMPTRRFENELHGFRWLDDLAAVGDRAAREAAQTWTSTWIARFGRGRGAGWSPDLTGRRLIRWINHAIFLLNGRSSEDSEAYFRSLAAQTRFLARRWSATAPGLPQFEALVGLIYAGLALQGMARHVDPAVKALTKAASQQIDAEGGLPTRNPEDLMEVFTLLVWAVQALVDADRTPPRELTDALNRMAPTLRALRHADGGLGRFHGGERGLDGRLDHALAQSGVKAQPNNERRAMGFSRLSASRTSVLFDVAPPPLGPASANAHASTLAFELTSGRRPLVVNCGSGASFGESWRRAGRATPSHSTLGITGFSSSRMGTRGVGRGETVELFEAVPGDVRVERVSGGDGTTVTAGHSGYVPSHGLTHVRSITLSLDGRKLAGEDTLSTFSQADRAIFDAMMTQSKMKGASFTIRFHLHPDVDATLDLGGTAVSMALKSSEIWVFRHDGSAELSLEPSVYLEAGRLRPRAAQQIVLSSAMQTQDQARQIRWTLSKAQDTPQGIRDLRRSDALPLD